MAANEVAIANMALARMRYNRQFSSASTVAALTEGGVATEQMKLWYAPTRQNVIRDYPWQFALRIARLTVVEEFDDADDEFGQWTFAYRYPTGALLLRAVRAPGENRKQVPPNEFELSSDVTGQLIFTDVEDAIAEYMTDVTVTTNYDAKFESAFAWRLAAEVASAVVPDDKARAACWQGYLMELQSAQVADANEQEQGPNPDGDFVRARGGA